MYIGFFVGELKDLGKLLFHLTDTFGVLADLVIDKVGGVYGFFSRVLRGFVQQHENQRHAHELAVECLAEVGSPGVKLYK